MRGWWRAALGVVVTVVVVGLGLLTYFVVAPATQRPAPTDLVVMLGAPYRNGMVSTAEQIAAVSPNVTVLISTPNGIPCRPLFAHQQCFAPSPSTTEGEARYGAAWAQAHGDRSITVVAPSFQAARARVWFDRCWSGHLSVVAAPTSFGSRFTQIPYQGAGFIKAEIFERRC